MHLGNLSVGIEGGIFRILPCYDMCSMGFAPVRNEVRPYSLELAQSHSRLNALNWNESGRSLVEDMAQDYWARITADPRISAEFQEFLAHGNPMNSIATQRSLSL